MIKRIKTIVRAVKLGLKQNQGEENIIEKYPDFTSIEWQIYNIVKDKTMTSPERVITLLRAVEYILHNNIEGDIVECGVWKGGSMMAIAELLTTLGQENRELYLYDTFEGMNQPNDVDISIDGIVASDYLEIKERHENDHVWAYSQLEEVTKNMASTNYPSDKLIYVQGTVEETIPRVMPEKIALLRLDTDWYASTKHELTYLFPKLVVGGVLIIDDYGHWQGCKQAVDEYFKENEIKIFFNRIDYTGRLGIKNA